jgi:ubiquitin carboxyl-terminal hydrolase L3
MSNWQPLESNCEVINKYLGEIGLDTSNFFFQDLLSIEEWAQEMIAKPVLGLLFIYEITEKQEAFRHKEEEALAKDGQVIAPGLFYMKQYAANACGTVGVFHILGNLPQSHQSLLKENSLLANFYAKVQGKNAEEAGKIFENNDELKEKHVSATEEGQTNVNEHQDTCNHFIAFVEKGGYIYELDGRKKRPVNHGPTSAETFLQDACLVAKGFMDREPENVNAGLIVLAPAPLE